MVMVQMCTCARQAWRNAWISPLPVLVDTFLCGCTSTSLMSNVGWWDLCWYTARVSNKAVCVGNLPAIWSRPCLGGGTSYSYMKNVPELSQMFRPNVGEDGSKAKVCRGWVGSAQKCCEIWRCWYVKSVEGDGTGKQGTWLRGRGNRVLRSCDLASSSSFWSKYSVLHAPPPPTTHQYKEQGDMGHGDSWE